MNNEVFLISYASIISLVPNTYVAKAERALQKKDFKELQKWMTAAKENFEHLTKDAKEKLYQLEIKIIERGNVEFKANKSSIAAHYFGVIYFSNRDLPALTESELEPLAKYVLALKFSSESHQLMRVLPAVLHKTNQDNCNLALRIPLFLSCVYIVQKNHIGDFLIAHDVEEKFPFDEPVPDTSRPHLAHLLYFALAPLQRDGEVERMTKLIYRIMLLTEDDEDPMSQSLYRGCQAILQTYMDNNMDLE